MTAAKSLLLTTLILGFAVSNGAGIPSSDDIRLRTKCFLGVRSVEYRVSVRQISSSTSDVMFERVDRRQVAQHFNIPGVLDTFDYRGTDLMLTFVSPGPASRVFTELGGKIEQVLKCSSRFGAVRSSLVVPPAILCFQGQQFSGNLIIPNIVEVYLKVSNGRYLRSKTLGYSEVVERSTSILSQEAKEKRN